MGEGTGSSAMGVSRAEFNALKSLVKDLACVSELADNKHAPDDHCQGAVERIRAYVERGTAKDKRGVAPDNPYAGRN